MKAWLSAAAWLSVSLLFVTVFIRSERPAIWVLCGAISAFTWLMFLLRLDEAIQGRE